MNKTLRKFQNRINSLDNGRTSFDLLDNLHQMSTGIGQWRRFNFFDKELIKRKDGKPFEDLKSLKVIGATSSYGSGDGHLIFGIADGSLCAVNQDYETNTFPLFAKEFHLITHSGGDTLCAVGLDEVNRKQTIRLIKTSKTFVDKEFVPIGKIISFDQDEHPNSKITAIAITDRHTAIGCENGSIYFFTSNDLVKEKRYKLSAPFFTQRDEPITNLAFSEVIKPKYDLLLYATTMNSVHSFRITPSTSSFVLPSAIRDRRPFHLSSPTNSATTTTTTTTSHTGNFQSNELESRKGCAPGCAVLATSEADGERQFIIANSTGIFSFVADDRRLALAIEGEKIAIHWWFNYLIIITKENRRAALSTPMIKTSSSSSALRPQSNIISQLTANQATPELQTLAVFEVNPQLTAFSVGMPQIQCVLDEWGYIYVLTGEGELHRLIEKDLHSRLNILFRKNGYQLALQIAKKNRTSKQRMAEIFKQYGDHLYARTEYESATDQYCKTIGFLEPSYVIKKFLDSQHIDHLTRYLEELHREKLANVDHTTLLLNCYTKHPDRIGRLAQFIGLNENLPSSTDADLAFDVDIAIDVCRQAGYCEQALQLSAKYRRHEKFIKIQIENLKQHQSALDYISKLKFEDAIESIRTYGKTLMKEQPKGTTQLLKELTPTPQQISEQNLPESLINLFMNHPDELLDYLDYAVSQYPSEHLPSTVYDTILELRLQKYNEIIEKKDKERWSERILQLLENTNVPLDVTRAMIACQKYNFKAGVISLYDREKLYQQILQFQMDNEESDEIVATCQKYGDNDPQLWVQALSYFSKLKRADGCQKEIEQILKYIDEKDLLSPLLVVQTLSNNQSTTLDLLKDYLIRKLRNEQEQINRDQTEIDSYRQESDKILRKIERLETEPILCQDPKCSACKMDLDIPCIHFFCEHSFHEHCAYPIESATTNEIIYECPLCSGDNRKLLDLIDNQRVGKNIHETFHRELDDRTDKFGVIAKFLGRRLFDKD